MDTTDTQMMRRALRQGVRSLGRTAPNPGVGCVLVREAVLGEGRHERAVRPARSTPWPTAARVATIRAGRRPITLAPCTRHGRTRPAPTR